MLETSALADLVVALPGAVRLQRLVCTLRSHFQCGAVVLLRKQDENLLPIAIDGLVQEALGRRFQIAAHPRLATLLARREPIRFDPGTELPDPYDGLLNEFVGLPLPVHDCMGTCLYVEGELWGALTLDALKPNTFTESSREQLRRYTLLIEAVLRTTRLEEEVRSLRMSRPMTETHYPSMSPTDDDIIGRAPALLHLLNEVDIVAASDLPVLLLGETGVGKELFARRIHRQSLRHSKALVHVNCAALPESLAESELFGHSKGAFSGAHSERPGRIEAAEGGTLFLDEVGELPLPVQAKLLRTLQNGEIQRLGEDTPRKVNVRIVAATNRDLKVAVANGVFRADLYHRLTVYPIPILPLRERGGDIVLLAGHFLELNRSRLGVRALRLSPEAEWALMQYAWPGNVRELEYVISRAAIKAVGHATERNAILTLKKDMLDLDSITTPTPTPLQSSFPTRGISLREAVEQSQRQAITAALESTQGNWSAAAKTLGVDASNLHKLGKRLGIKTPR